MESVDDRIIMFEKQMTFCFTLLPLDYPYLPRHTDTTYDLSTLSEGVKISDLEQLKTDAAKCLTDSLFKKLLDVEEVMSYWNEHVLSKFSATCQLELTSGNLAASSLLQCWGKLECADNSHIPNLTPNSNRTGGNPVYVLSSLYGEV